MGLQLERSCLAIVAREHRRPALQQINDGLRSVKLARFPPLMQKPLMATTLHDRRALSVIADDEIADRKTVAQVRDQHQMPLGSELARGVERLPEAITLITQRRRRRRVLGELANCVWMEQPPRKSVA